MQCIKTIKRHLGRLLLALLFGIAFWQFGQGVYIPAKAWVAQELMHRAWLRAGTGSHKPAPWPWADTYPVARLSAKGGDVELIVLEGGSGRTLAFGPGHLSISLPSARRIDVDEVVGIPPRPYRLTAFRASGGKAMR